VRANGATSKSAPVAVALGLSLLVLAVYWQTGSHAFITLDDAEYVYENSHVGGGLSAEGFRWAFTTFHAANWHPLTWLSHMADVELFGIDAGWHHRMNVVLHLANTVLLFLVLWRMTGGLWQCAFVAALFAVHPLHVESVAWVAERKDLLSTLFWLLTMGAYLGYVRNPGVARYLPLAALFSLGLMCKPMLVTLPFVLLLLDWWPLGRLSRPAVSRRVAEKVPLLLLSAVSSIITYMAQGSGRAVASLQNASFVVRVSNALVSCATYLWKAVWPASLSVFYPHPVSVHVGIPEWEIAGAALLLAGISFLAFRERQRRPYLAVGWLWYLGTLVPVIGLVQVGAASHADRYTYVPLIGIFVAVAWGVPDMLSGRSWRRLALGVAGGAAVAALSAAAYVQTGYWRDSITLFSRSLAVTERNWMARTNLGIAYEALGKSREAVQQYREALRIDPDFAEAWYDLGVSTEKLGEPQEAIGYYREALRLNPDLSGAWYNLGVSAEKSGKPQEAMEYYRKALRSDPEFAKAWYNLGLGHARLGQIGEAIGFFREAVRNDPRYADAWYNLGVAHAKLGRPGDAVGFFREAVRIAPDFVNAWYGMGLAYARLGRFRDTIACFRETVRIRPDFAEGWHKLGLAYEEVGDHRQADESFREAQRFVGK
jgi:tetratricopeptide (TPR) repeat protein